MTDSIFGIFPVLPTPFADDGGVDRVAMRKLVAFAIEQGASGLVFPGFASEVEHLSGDERTELLGIVAEEARGRVAVVAGASAGSEDEVIAHGSTARHLGIEYVMVQPPVAIGSSARAVTRFFDEIARGLPNVGIVLQNAPAPRGSDLSPETILKIAAEVPGIAYVKEETLPAGPAISAIMAKKPESLAGAIGGGGARYIIDEFRRGACAAMPAVELTDIHAEINSAFRSGNLADARKLYGRTLPLLVLQAIFRMRLTKHVMMRRGILTNARVRAKIPPMDRFTIEDMDANLALLGLIEDPN